MTTKPRMYVFLVEKGEECRTIFVAANNKTEAKKSAEENGWKVVKRTPEDKKIEKRVNDFLKSIDKKKKEN